jgi:hypothetical protein
MSRFSLKTASGFLSLFAIFYFRTPPLEALRGSQAGATRVSGRTRGPSSFMHLKGLSGQIILKGLSGQIILKGLSGQILLKGLSGQIIFE